MALRQRKGEFQQVELRAGRAWNCPWAEEGAGAGFPTPRLTALTAKPWVEAAATKTKPGT